MAIPFAAGGAAMKMLRMLYKAKKKIGTGSKIAAEKAAPYVHPKLANTTSKIGTDEPIQIKVQWQKES